METAAETAQLKDELDGLHRAAGTESQRMARERVAREADEARQRQRDALEGTGLAEYLACLEGQGLLREWEELDKLSEGILAGWQRVVQARADRTAAQKKIEEFMEVFGGNLPPSWEAAKRELVDKQSRGPEDSSGRLWHRHRVSQLARALVGRSR